MKIGPYETGRVYQGDCLELMKAIPDGSVHLVVTSPPYNQIQGSSMRGGSFGKLDGWRSRVSGSAYSDERPENEYQAWMRSVVDACRTACSGTVFVNHKVRHRDGKAIHPLAFLPTADLWAEIIWSRPGGVAFNAGRFVPSHEGIYAFGRPLTFDQTFGTMFTVWGISPGAGKDGHADTDGHPCPFPVEIPRRLIAATTRPGDVVLDPFTGSGTTGVAAAMLGREFLGFELDPHWCQVANDRIRGVHDGLSVRERRAGQASLLDLIEE